MNGAHRHSCISLGVFDFFACLVLGSGTLRVWELDLLNRKIKPTECQTGKLKRIVKCIEVQFHFRYALVLLPSGTYQENIRGTVAVDAFRLINHCSFGNTTDYDITQWHFGLSFRIVDLIR